MRPLCSLVVIRIYKKELCGFGVMKVDTDSSSLGARYFHSYGWSFLRGRWLGITNFGIGIKFHFVPLVSHICISNICIHCVNSCD